MTYLEHLKILFTEYSDTSEKFRVVNKEENNFLSNTYFEIKNKWLAAMNNYFEISKFVRNNKINLGDTFFG